jgi:hypothetical protein
VQAPGFAWRTKTLRKVDLEHMLGSTFEALYDRRDGILRTKEICRDSDAGRTSRSRSYKPLNLLNISFIGHIGLKNN